MFVAGFSGGSSEAGATGTWGTKITAAKATAIATNKPDLQSQHCSRDKSLRCDNKGSGNMGSGSMGGSNMGTATAAAACELRGESHRPGRVNRVNGGPDNFGAPTGCPTLWRHNARVDLQR